MLIWLVPNCAAAEMAKFVLNVGGILHCMGHFVAQQPAVAPSHVTK